MRRPAIAAWVKDNWPGLLIALVVTVVAWLAIHPALRILSDEANLVGTSKNLFASRTATFTVSGKNYYDTYWDIDVAIDRRPALFPFLVSLVHVVRGYAYKNVFAFNLLLLPAFVLVAYRLAKSLGGETFGVVAALLVVAHPITLIAVRSGGFDFCALFFSLLVLKSLFDHVREPSAGTAGDSLDEPVHVRRGPLRERACSSCRWWRCCSSSGWPAGHCCVRTPSSMRSRRRISRRGIWQAALRGSVPDQEVGVAPISVGYFVDNLREYFRPVLSPLDGYPAHAGIVIALGLVGCVLLAVVAPARDGASTGLEESAAAVRASSSAPGCCFRSSSSSLTCGDARRLPRPRGW